MSYQPYHWSPRWLSPSAYRRRTFREEWDDILYHYGFGPGTWVWTNAGCDYLWLGRRWHQMPLKNRARPRLAWCLFTLFEGREPDAMHVQQWGTRRYCARYGMRMVFMRADEMQQIVPLAKKVENITSNLRHG